MSNWTEEEYAVHMALKAPQEAPAHSPDVPEAFIEAECTKLLEEDGWRALRTDPVSDRGRGKWFGEVGMPDFEFKRYLHPDQSYVGLAQSEVMHIEFKRGKGGVVSKAQRAWHIKERARGALTLIAGEDFPASVSGFAAWYTASGLRRRIT